jgi:hypothetical protein
MNMKGTPSNRMLKKEIEKSCKLNVNQLITRHYKSKQWSRYHDSEPKRNGHVHPSALELPACADEQQLCLLGERWRVLENLSS